MPRAADAASVSAYSSPFERDNRKPLTYAANEQHRLLAADPVLARHPGKSREDLGQTMRSTAAGRFFKLNEQVEAGLVVNVIAVEHRHQYGCIEKTLHSPLPRFARSRSSRICRSISSVAEEDSGCPV